MEWKIIKEFGISVFKFVIVMIILEKRKLVGLFYFFLLLIEKEVN